METNKVKDIMPDWSKMPKEILELFCKLLTIPDQVMFGTACKTWHAATLNKSQLWVPDTPWLITNDDTNSKFRLYSYTHNKKFQIQKLFKPFEGYSIAGSSKGWLVMRSEEEVFILNIFSNIRIDLPPLNLLLDHIPMSDSEEDLELMELELMELPLCFAISTCPNLNPIQVASVTFDGCLTWFKLGNKVWKRYRGDYEYGNIAFHNEKLYAIDRDGTRIDVFEVDDESLVLVPLPDSILIPTNQNPRSNTFEVYLIESNGRLLVVKRYTNSVAITAPTIGFDVLEVQEKQINCSSHEPMVVNVDSLDDQALFVSHLMSESVSGNKCSKHQKGRIYFAGYDELGVYAVKEQQFFTKTLTPNATYDNPIWVMPRFAFACDCNLHDSTMMKKQEPYVNNPHQENDVVSFPWEVDVKVLSMV